MVVQSALEFQIFSNNLQRTRMGSPEAIKPEGI